MTDTYGIPESMHDKTGDPKRTTIDYIVVGSGAGGAPLASRLARAGMRVLVLEAGPDPGAGAAPDASKATENERPLYYCPGFHEASTEPHEHGAPVDHEISWDFRVRHFADDAMQAGDAKAVSDPHEPKRKGVFYPRCSAIGGCTAHNALISVYASDREWRNIELMTADPSWAPNRMRYYFQRVERTSFGKYRSRFGRHWQKLVQRLRPEVFASSRRGHSGWLDITSTDPKIAMADKQFLKLVVKSALGEEIKGLGSIWRWIKRIVLGEFYRDLDPNDAAYMKRSPEGVVLVPISALNGVRRGPRELLLETHRDLCHRNNASSGELFIETGVFVTRVLFEPDPEGGPPRAVGVACKRGRNLYRANHEPGTPGDEEEHYYSRRETILSAGAFNTPQILMLSGIGEAAHLKKHGITGLGGRDAKESAGPVVDLPGVGRNLQDRYEISVVSRLKDSFEVLRGVTFRLDADEDDDALRAWKDTRRGPYSTSGAAIGIMKKSRSELDEPDLFLFGFPTVFRGYYPGWSRHLLLAPPTDGTLPVETSDGDGALQRDLWSWVILKAHTNNTGDVRLRSADAFETPEINFRSFGSGESGEGRSAKDDPDLAALLTAVAYARGLNGKARALMKNQNAASAELLPGRSLTDGSPGLERWIKQNTWGHHACGTCRIGADPWRASVDGLEDREAVVDSRFRVHGVRDLRVVDTSVFPQIPGYFIATPTFVISEKASDAILEHATHYPPALERSEADLVAKRRKKARTRWSGKREQLPDDTVGVALSGGGIRSATFSFGVLQALAGLDRIRWVDYLSTVSGGAYIGSFLGRLFTRMNVTGAKDPCGEVQKIVSDNASLQSGWLRTHADYLTGAGRVDLHRGLAALWRNLLTVYFVLACLGVAVFGSLRVVGERLPEWLAVPPGLPGVALLGGRLSPWWWLPVVAVVAALVPGAIAYWLAPQTGTRTALRFLPTLAAVLLLAGAVVATALPGGVVAAGLVVTVMVFTFLLIDVARRRDPMQASRPDRETDPGLLLRNRLTRGLGEALVLFGIAVLWVVVDTLARTFAEGRLMSVLLVWGAIVAPTTPFLRALTSLLICRRRESARSQGRSGKIVAALIAFPLALLLVILLLTGVHALFNAGTGWGSLLTVLAITLTLVLGHVVEFANGSSLHRTYAARLARCFLGASNETRLAAAPSATTRDVQVMNSEDDIAFDAYHPEQNGGPLHLIGICVNETVDTFSARDIPGRKGLPMCVGPNGLSVGVEYHALWTKRCQYEPWHQRLSRLTNGKAPGITAACGIRVPGNPFHVLRRKGDDAIPVEPLSLGAWIAISGAAFGTGRGRATSLPQSLLAGLANLRLGYWWDTRLSAYERPERFRENLWRRLKKLPGRLAPMQSLILAELQGRFEGPTNRYWYLSDGGHFDNTGVYELLRRRLRLIIVVDGTTDPELLFGDLAALTRQVRGDFGAEIEFLEPKAQDGWGRFAASIPSGIQRWIDPDQVGGLDSIGRDGGHRAALARVRYTDGDERESWLLLLKAVIVGDEPIDIAHYKQTHPSFPSESTLDQFLDEAQWESYRKLGEITGRKVIIPA